MALLNHRNVPTLAGVVTAPRDLPALVLMLCCDGGGLLEHVWKAGAGGLSAAKLLTVAAQVALGMQHISSCSIVHRDHASRNLLLDSTPSRVADFSMSASLVRAGKLYAAEYVRVQEEISLRWAAPEALHDQRFSVQSDVWSFGVMVWELFAAGGRAVRRARLGRGGPLCQRAGPAAASSFPHGRRRLPGAGVHPSVAAMLGARRKRAPFLRRALRFRDSERRDRGRCHTCRACRASWRFSVALGRTRRWHFVAALMSASQMPDQVARSWGHRSTTSKQRCYPRC